MERYAYKAAETNIVNDYWCDIATRPELYCLDIGAPSTLSNTLNVTAFDLTTTTVFSNGNFIEGLYDSVDNTSTALFGQYDRCGDKLVGDGLINVFDISTLISYIFKDYQYASLSLAPEQIVTVQGRERLPLYCSDIYYRVDYYAHYAYDTCTFFEDRPLAPPPSPNPPPPATSGRRLQQSSSTPLLAADIADRWRSRPLTPLLPNPVRQRDWLPVPYHSVETVQDFQLARADHSVVPDYEYDTGRWYTLRTASLSLRLHAVFSGLPSGQTSTELSYRLYDGTPPQDATRRSVRFTRFCEFGQCDNTCASIETSFPRRQAMSYNTLELVQRPISKACPFEVHLWVPKTVSYEEECIGIEYIMIADGVRGQFARNTPCAKNLLSPPPPPIILLPQPPPSPGFPTISLIPPPPPAYGNTSSLPPLPPSNPAPLKSRPFSIWWIGVVVLALSCCCVVGAFAVRRYIVVVGAKRFTVSVIREKKNDDLRPSQVVWDKPTLPEPKRKEALVSMPKTSLSPNDRENVVTWNKPTLPEPKRKEALSSVPKVLASPTRTNQVVWNKPTLPEKKRPTPLSLPVLKPEEVEEDTRPNQVVWNKPTLPPSKQKEALGKPLTKNLNTTEQRV